jgi:hypothetical protein
MIPVHTSPFKNISEESTIKFITYLLREERTTTREAGEYQLLEADTRERLVKTQQVGKVSFFSVE